MAVIQPNTFNEQDTEYFMDFIPYRTPGGTEATEEIRRMVSYDVIVRQDPVVIDQIFGAVDTFSFTIRFRNMTTNVDLQLDFSSGPQFSISDSFITLPPGQDGRVDVSVNNDIVNESAGAVDFISNLNINVTNLRNGTIPLVNTSLSRLSTRTLSDVEIR